jgi:hypothetical protein
LKGLKRSPQNLRSALKIQLSFIEKGEKYYLGSEVLTALVMNIFWEKDVSEEHITSIFSVDNQPSWKPDGSR